MHPYATHVPALVAAIRRTTGPVLELGAGWFSTPLIHGLAYGRTILTVETSDRWVRTFWELFGNNGHGVRLVPTLSERWAFYDQAWDVALVDGWPEHDRPFCIRNLRGQARVIVVHDVERAEIGPALADMRFRYRLDVRPPETATSDPVTAVVSDDVDVSQWR